MPPRIRVSLLPIVVLLWLGCAVFGFACLGERDGAAGASGHPPAQWQPSPLVALDPAKPTLVMLVHPKCPCSRASLSELNHLMALCPNRAAVSVLFLQPAGYSSAWSQAALWRQAAAIPGVRVRVDDNAETARRFGAATSGEALLYAPSGRLLYHGGLTGARGHEGDNAGLSAVAALLEEQPDAQNKARPVQEPIYGCPLFSCPRTACRTTTPNRGGASWPP